MNDDKLKAIGKILNAADEQEQQSRKSAMSRRWFIRTLGGVAAAVAMGAGSKANAVVCDGCNTGTLHPCPLQYVCHTGDTCGTGGNTCNSGNTCETTFDCTKSNECVVNNVCYTTNHCSPSNTCDNGNICLSSNQCTSMANTCTRNNTPPCKLFN